MRTKWHNSLIGIIMVGIVSIAVIDGCALLAPVKFTWTLKADKSLLSRAKAMTDGEAIELIQDLIKDTNHEIIIGGGEFAQRYANEDKWITSVDKDLITGRCIRHVVTNIQANEKGRKVSFRVEQNDFNLSWDDIEDLTIDSDAHKKMREYGYYTILIYLRKEKRYGACFDSIDDLNHANDRMWVHLRKRILYRNQNDAIEYEGRLIAAFARLFPETKRWLAANQAL